MADQEIRIPLYWADPADPLPEPSPTIGMTIIKDGLPPHPGNLLREEMARIAISPYRLAKLIGVQRSRLERMVAETHPVSPDTALRLAKFFGGPAERWMDMQTRHDLAVHRKEIEVELAAIKCIRG